MPTGMTLNDLDNQNGMHPCRYGILLYQYSTEKPAAVVVCMIDPYEKFGSTIATSYIVKEENRTFRSEYIISQSLMMACKKLGYDGIAYYSRRVDDEIFALCAINLALFVDYNGEYSDIYFGRTTHDVRPK